MWSGVRALVRPGAGMRAAGHLLNRPARTPRVALKPASLLIGCSYFY